MTREDRLDRRQLLAAGIGLAVALPPLAAGVAAAVGPLPPDEGGAEPGDLMKEHGVLNRCLLVYEEACGASRRSRRRRRKYSYILPSWYVPSSRSTTRGTRRSTSSPSSRRR